VQVGTPEELIASPADEYVANFVLDFPKSHVLTLRWIARPASNDSELQGPALPATMVIRDASRAVLDANGPVRVVDDAGNVIGVVSSEEILAVIAGVPA
jgi:glycine betaine/proline transport system ATP-binding protein